MNGSFLILSCRRLLVFVAALFMAMAATVAFAQTRPVPVPAVLTNVTLVTESASESRFQLTFAPKANTFAAIGNEQNRPSLGFALSSRQASAVTPPGLKGLVRTISFEQADTILIMRFGVTTPAVVAALPTGDRTVDVIVKSGTLPGPQPTDGGPGAAGGLPAAQSPPPGEDGYELVLLKYADVSEVVGILSDGAPVKSNDLFIPREPAFGSSSLTGSNSYNAGQTSQAPGSDLAPLGQAVDSGMAIDRRLNGIWLKGSPDRIARMKAMIATIDIPLDSVILETQFVELTESGSKAIGIDFANANGQIAVATVQMGQFIPPGIPSGSRLVSANFQAAIYAQIAKGNGRIVSKPRISAQSGSTAKIITGDAIPILTNITLSGVNGVSQQVQYVNVGVTLQIAPRVSSDGFVSSHIFVVVSSVTGTSQGYPTISQREAETSATVRDGEPFVIGGLSQEDVIKTRTKVPLLGDIPLLGQAFRTDRSTRSKTELYIVVTPHIVHRVPSGSVVIVPPTPSDTTR